MIPSKSRNSGTKIQAEILSPSSLTDKNYPKKQSIPSTLAWASKGKNIIVPKTSPLESASTSMEDSARSSMLTILLRPTSNINWVLTLTSRKNKKWSVVQLSTKSLLSTVTVLPKTLWAAFLVFSLSHLKRIWLRSLLTINTYWGSRPDWYLRTRMSRIESLLFHFSVETILFRSTKMLIRIQVFGVASFWRGRSMSIRERADIWSILISR